MEMDKKLSHALASGTAFMIEVEKVATTNNNIIVATLKLLKVKLIINLNNSVN